MTCCSFSATVTHCGYLCAVYCQQFKGHDCKLAETTVFVAFALDERVFFQAANAASTVVHHRMGQHAPTE